MYLLIGLGNPGRKYKNTPHNIGFRILNLLIENKKWKESKAINCLWAKKIIGGQEIMLIKPLGFMNNSGEAVKRAQNKHNVETEKIIVLHDDFSLPKGRIKINKNRGAAGHKGVESIIHKIGSKDFIRVRVGVKPKKNIKSIKRFVLLPAFKKRFSEEEKAAAGAIKMLFSCGLEKAMARYNQKK